MPDSDARRATFNRQLDRCCRCSADRDSQGRSRWCLSMRVMVIRRTKGWTQVGPGRPGCGILLSTLFRRRWPLGYVKEGPDGARVHNLQLCTTRLSGMMPGPWTAATLAGTLDGYITARAQVGHSTSAEYYI